MRRPILMAICLSLVMGASNGITPKKPDSTSHKVRETIRKLHLAHPEIVYAQAVLESNHFKSKLFIENNNMFGMKMPKRRPTTAYAENNGYATYASIEDCILDYALYQSSYLRNLTQKQYLSKLGSIYAEDPQYTNKLWTLIK